MRNYGARYEPTNKDWVFGGVSGIDNSEILSRRGDWVYYLPENERQKVGKVETYACGIFSALNCLETLMNFYLLTDRLRSEDKYWFHQKGYIVNNRFNFSDKYISILSNTTMSGNYMHKVGDAIIEYGLIPENMLPFGNPSDFWEYHKKKLITEEMKELGREFNERVKIRYEFVRPDDRDEARKYAPLQVMVYAWAKNGDGEYINKGNSYNHFVEDYAENWIFDHYNPFKKKLVDDYKFRAAVKYSINFTKPMPLKLNNNCLVRNFETGERALHLDGKLLIGDPDDVVYTWMDRSTDFNNKKTIVGLEWDKFDLYNIGNPNEKIVRK